MNHVHPERLDLAHSDDLEVAHYNGLEIAHPTYSDASNISPYGVHGTKLVNETLPAMEEREAKRIYGCVPKVFYSILAVVATIILVGAIGGGVGGSLAAKQNKASSS